MRVYLVATGIVHEGEETYTRHDGQPPPLSDSECLCTQPSEPVAHPDAARFDWLVENVGYVELHSADYEGFDGITRELVDEWRAETKVEKS